MRAFGTSEPDLAINHGIFSRELRIITVARGNAAGNGVVRGEFITTGDREEHRGTATGDIFRADGANGDRGFIFEIPSFNILDRIRTNR